MQTCWRCVYINIELIHKDCFEVLPNIPSNSVDLILTDPPYLISRDSGFANISDRTPAELKTKYGKHKIDFGDWDKKPLNLDTLFFQFYRILKSKGTLIMFFDVWKMQTVKDIAEVNKFKQLRLCRWDKTNPVPVNSKLNYLSNCTEYFISCVKGGTPTFHSEYDNGVYSYPICHGKERTKHPTQKPLALIKALIEKHSNEDDLVLDCFMGSGTTGEACQITRRRFVGIEADDNFYSIAHNRIYKENEPYDNHNTN